MPWTLILALFAAALSAIAAYHVLPAPDGYWSLAAAIISFAVAFSSRSDSRRGERALASAMKKAEQELASAVEAEKLANVQATMEAVEIAEAARHGFGS
jgi:hypothetical protein